MRKSRGFFTSLLDLAQIKSFEKRYDQIIEKGLAENPLMPFKPLSREILLFQHADLLDNLLSCEIS